MVNVMLTLERKNMFLDSPNDESTRFAWIATIWNGKKENHSDEINAMAVTKIELLLCVLKTHWSHFDMDFMNIHTIHIL